MISLTEQLRDFIDTLDEYGYAPVDKKSMQKSHIKFKKSGSHVVPSTIEGKILDSHNEYIANLIFNIDSNHNLPEEKREEIKQKIKELEQFAKTTFQ